nr:Uncharacterised protein [Streptococcus thermophilus]
MAGCFTYMTWQFSGSDASLRILKGCQGAYRLRGLSGGGTLDRRELEIETEDRVLRYLRESGVNPILATRHVA